ncbi:hypothetical protein RJ55_07595 [Drechmeria coniospora]|nr:hypothetical protein RJ55_07595 [Drechmeria coniospora]
MVIPTSSTPPPANRRLTQSSRLTPPEPAASAAALSSSEPSLRFPRPQGNRRLANWVSSSNPDVMRLAATVEETGLADSAYELINGTDGESPDDNYAGSMDESVDSLDFQRPDDVQSLAGTENTQDDDSIADEADTLPPASTMDLRKDGEVEEGVVDAPGDDARHEASSNGSEADETLPSLSSLEYTQISLGTPSIATPEANKRAAAAGVEAARSALEDQHQDTDSSESAAAFQFPPRSSPALTPDGSILLERRSVPEPPRHGGRCKKTNPARAKFAAKLADDGGIWAHFKDRLPNTTSATLPGLLLATALAILIPILYSPPADGPRPEMATVTTTITATTTSVVIATSTPSSLSRPSTSSTTGGMGLIPVGDNKSDEGLFGAKRPILTFTPHAQTDILIRVPSSIKQTWLAKNCLVVDATRGDQQVQAVLSPVGDGILVKFAKKEAYGVIKLSVRATCRPRVQKMIKVHFGRGVVEEALQMTKNLAQDLSGLVPAAAEEAGRCLKRARRSLGAVSDTITNNVVFSSETMLGRLWGSVAASQGSFLNANAAVLGRIRGVAEDLAESLGTTSRQAREHLHRVQDIQAGLRLRLLGAQVSAKMWWLRATGGEKEHEDYEHKAREFVASQHAAARAASWARRPREDVDVDARS